MRNIYLIHYLNVITTVVGYGIRLMHGSLKFKTAYEDYS